jgi:hypothetical protein
MIILPASKPLARISYCTYPGSGPSRTGHSFISIEPIDSQFRSGIVRLNQQAYIGRVAIGITPKNQRGCKPLMQIKTANNLQLRNDYAYLIKKNLRAASVEIKDSDLLLRGMARVNDAALSLDQSHFTIQSINHLEASASSTSVRMNSTLTPSLNDSELSQFLNNNLAQSRSFTCESSKASSSLMMTLTTSKF